MKKSLFCLLLFFSSLCFAADVTWDGGGVGDRWLTSENWNTDAIPGAADRVFLLGAGETILIEDGDSINITKVLGPGRSGDQGVVTLRMTGGSLSNPSYWYYAAEPSYEGVIEIDGTDTLLFTRDLAFGYNGGIGRLNINGGTVNVYGSGEGLMIPRYDDGSSEAYINLDGGQLIVTSLTIYTGGQINITSGQMQLSDDQRTLVNSYISAGKIKAYGGTSPVEVDFDNINAGMTTVYATPNGFTIQEMINSANPDDTILVPAGIYDEGQFDINKSINLKAVDGPSETIIKVTGNGMCITESNITIEGFTIENQIDSLNYLVRIGRSVDDTSYSVGQCVIKNCVVKCENLTDGITVYPDANDIDIQSCLVSDCVNGVVVYDNVNNVYIIDNDIYNNLYGVRILGSEEQVTVLANGIYWNTNFGVMNSGINTLDAENNFWGKDSGPYNALGNPDGEGNPVSDLIDFRPFFMGCNDDRWHICPDGDSNGDCKIDFVDLSKLAESWLTCNGPNCE